MMPTRQAIRLCFSCLLFAVCAYASAATTAAKPTAVSADIAYLSPMDHLGIIVRNADQEAANLVARFGAKIVSKQTLHFNHATYQGKTLSYSGYFVFVAIGNSKIEFIQPDMDAPSPYLDILKEKGEYAHHVCFVVKSRQDIDRQLAKAPHAKVVVRAHAGNGAGGDMVYAEGLIPGILVELATPIE